MSFRISKKPIEEASPLLDARLAGCLYILIILGGLFAPFAIAPSGMMLQDAALPTPDKILAAKQLYVLGGVAQLLVYTCDIGVALLFYELLNPVNKKLALAAASFRLAFAVIASANIIVHFVPLILLDGGNYLTTFSPSQLRVLALAALRLRTYGFDIALFFFGFHCLVAGYLFFKSTFVPRILGIALAIGGIGYLANILATAIPPAVRSQLFPYILLPAGVAEISLALWLMIAGVNVPKWRIQASAAQ